MGKTITVMPKPMFQGYIYWAGGAYVSVNKNGNLYLIQLQNSKIKPLLWMARAIKEIPFALEHVF
jgi:hypothetical protein